MKILESDNKPLMWAIVIFTGLVIFGLVAQDAHAHDPCEPDVLAATFEAVIVERRDGWYLLQSALGSGWVPVSAIQTGS